MIKSDIVSIVAEKTGFSQKDVRDILNASIDTIKDGICSDGEVVLRGFGTFKAVDCSPRVGRDLRNNRALKIPGKVRLKFKSHYDI